MLVCNGMLESRAQNAEEFARALETYLTSVLHQSLRLGAWSDDGELPSFLASKYVYYQTKIAHRPCLFMAALDGQTGTPTEISKHVAQVQRVFDGIVAYAAPRISSHQRARLIKHGVAFAVPGNQLYLPQLATDLREHYRAQPSRADDQLMPAAQVLLFHHALGRNPGLTTPSSLSDPLCYSAMSIGRGFDQLVSLGLARVIKTGREKHISFDRAPQELIAAARPYLRSPVGTTHYFHWNPIVKTLKMAGETALAERTALTPPFLQVCATTHEHWKTIRANQGLEAVKHEEEAAIAIEVWRYDPAVLSDTQVVDVLSLYAQFWKHPDERVVAAANDLLARLP